MEATIMQPAWVRGETADQASSRLLPDALRIVNVDADRRFRRLAEAHGQDPKALWVGGYVQYEWTHARYYLENRVCSVRGKDVLEFGCNTGATAIVMAALGARVTAIDIDEFYVALAALNAERYGFADHIRFVHVADSTHLPFHPRTFDLVSCNSVLDYVPSRVLTAVQLEINRVLNPGGLISIMGTSNRLWPCEVHSRRWLVNYVPRWCDAFLGRFTPQRGASPLRLRFGFGEYEDVTATDRGRMLTAAKASMGFPAYLLRVLALSDYVLSIAGLSAGMFLPSIYLLLRKQEPSAVPEGVSRDDAPSVGEWRDSTR